MQKRTRFSGIETEFLFRLCDCIGSTVAYQAQDCLTSNSSDVLKLALDPAHYCNSWSFALDYAIVSGLSKWTGWRTGVNLRAVALEKWRQSEIRCAATNRYIASLRSGSVDPDASIIQIARGKIAKVLGEVVDLRQLIEHSRWGGGATFSLKRADARVDKKIRVVPISVTRRALPYIQKAIQADPHWLAAILGKDYEVGCAVSLLPSCFRLVEGCRFTTVPKNAKTDRTIAIEPTANAFLQRGLGRYIRQRLRRFGVDLRKQEINQTAAREGCRLGLATLDLSAASDSICKELVYELLPVDWAALLDDLRSPVFVVGKREHILLQKFSSMGNGFTFELETLIFWALTSAVCNSHGHQNALVYGDDIIVPQSVASAVVPMLERMGFSTNLDKSFVDGPFRESCGGHYFNGQDVTPFYQKEVVRDEVTFIRFHNRVFRWLLRVGSGYLPLQLKPALDFLRSFEKGKLRDSMLPPDSEADTGLLRENWHCGSCWRLLVKTKERRLNQRAALQYHFHKSASLVNSQGLDILNPPEIVSETMISREIGYAWEWCALGSTDGGLRPLGTRWVTWV